LKASEAELSQIQRERLAFLEMRAFFTGELHRGDIEARYGIKPAAAARDLRIYRGLSPANLDYDAVGRRYRPTPNFKPLYRFHPERVLSWLLQGFGDGLELAQKQVAPCEGPGQLGQPDIEVLGRVTRAICAKRALRIEYLSLSSGPRKRVIVPLALADNGQRWHVRSYDRERKRFSDFALTRIVKALEIDDDVADHELLPADEQWARIVELELVPHPGIKWPKAIEADYGMQGGILKVKTRAALAGYVLRRWSVDSTEDHSLDPTPHHLWLSNPQTLYGVESAPLAPGRAVQSEKGKP